MAVGEYNSQLVKDFHGRILAESATLAGYAALTERFRLTLPLPARLAAISARHHPESTNEWLMLTPRHAPAGSLAGQLEFALK
jgi:hypothetical protein